MLLLLLLLLLLLPLHYWRRMMPLACLFTACGSGGAYANRSRTSLPLSDSTMVSVHTSAAGDAKTSAGSTTGTTATAAPVKKTPSFLDVNLVDLSGFMPDDASRIGRSKRNSQGSVKQSKRRSEEYRARPASGTSSTTTSNANSTGSKESVFRRALHFRNPFSHRRANSADHWTPEISAPILTPLKSLANVDPKSATVTTTGEFWPLGDPVAATATAAAPVVTATTATIAAAAGPVSSVTSGVSELLDTDVADGAVEEHEPLTPALELPIAPQPQRPLRMAQHVRQTSASSILAAGPDTADAHAIGGLGSHALKRASSTPADISRMTYANGAQAATTGLDKVGARSIWPELDGRATLPRPPNSACARIRYRPPALLPIDEQFGARQVPPAPLTGPAAVHADRYRMTISAMVRSGCVPPPLRPVSPARASSTGSSASTTAAFFGRPSSARNVAGASSPGLRRPSQTPPPPSSAAYQANRRSSAPAIARMPRSSPLTPVTPSVPTVVISERADGPAEAASASTSARRNIITSTPWTPSPPEVDEVTMAKVMSAEDAVTNDVTHEAAEDENYLLRLDVGPRARMDSMLPSADESDEGAERRRTYRRRGSHRPVPPVPPLPLSATNSGSSSVDKATAEETDDGDTFPRTTHLTRARRSLRRSQDGVELSHLVMDSGELPDVDPSSGVDGKDELCHDRVSGLGRNRLVASAAFGGLSPIDIGHIGVGGVPVDSALTSACTRVSDYMPSPLSPTYRRSSTDVTERSFYDEHTDLIDGYFSTSSARSSRTGFSLQQASAMSSLLDTGYAGFIRDARGAYGFSSTDEEQYMGHTPTSGIGSVSPYRVPRGLAHVDSLDELPPALQSHDTGDNRGATDDEHKADGAAVDADAFWEQQQSKRDSTDKSVRRRSDRSDPEDYAGRHAAAHRRESWTQRSLHQRTLSNDSALVLRDRDSVVLPDSPLMRTSFNAESDDKPRTTRLSVELTEMRRKLASLYWTTEEADEESDDSKAKQEVDRQLQSSVSVSSGSSAQKSAHDTASGDASKLEEVEESDEMVGYGWVAKNVRRVVHAARDGYRDDPHDTPLPRLTITIPAGCDGEETVDSVELNGADDDDGDDTELDDEQIEEENHKSLTMLLNKQTRAESILVRSLELMRDGFWQPLREHYVHSTRSTSWFSRRTHTFTSRSRSRSRTRTTSSASPAATAAELSTTSMLPLTHSFDSTTEVDCSNLGPESPAFSDSGTFSTNGRRSQDSTPEDSGYTSVKRMAEMIEMAAASSDVNSMVKEVDAVFAFIPMLLGFHMEFLSELRTLQRENATTAQVVAVFVRRVRGLRIYTDFVDHFPRALVAFERMYCKDTHFAKQVRGCERDAGHVNLRALLVKPRERIRAYVGFLEVVADLCPSYSPEQEAADKCVDELHRLLECLAPDIDRIIMLEQAAAVQRHITGLPRPLLHIESQLLYQGDLLYYPKAGQASGRMRCFLFNDRMVVTKETGEHQYAHQTTVCLASTVATASEASTGRFRHVFCLRAGVWPAIFQADNWDEFRAWTERLRGALEALPKDPKVSTRFRFVTKLQVAQMENTSSPVVAVPHFF
ncbi:hypothetical protein THASP1DRAFT_21934 [Thamnocephalis sphaerospora]|uniref:DH domain-containing protein n=1 Tax=Thamnocephalis sphaerospora TaxID=78915 RepID=A0A4P9XVP5_9FUNG|nr:hypothetical protein THASP1DRAFT_21934 [Thamnocephalis sphaerospora]|eukprot:RKP10353.1 hypothetical protein THASP1DRAFT_21934 [Thamnocephalis sphaerospora]